MPLLNAAADLHLGSTRADVAYQNGVQVWPDPEIWSSWIEVGYAVTPSSDGAWYAGGIVDAYDTGVHERPRFRYSNKGRVHWRGIMKNISGTTIGAGGSAIGCQIVGSSTIPMPPKPVDDNRMVYGVSGAKADMGGWGGTTVRYNVAPYTYHHLLNVAVHDASAIANGAWFAIDAIFSFAADT